MRTLSTLVTLAIIATATAIAIPRLHLAILANSVQRNPSLVPVDVFGNVCNVIRDRSGVRLESPGSDGLLNTADDFSAESK